MQERFAVLAEVNTFVKEELRVNGRLRDIYPDVCPAPTREQLEEMRARSLARRPVRRWVACARQALTDWLSTAKRRPRARVSHFG